MDGGEYSCQVSNVMGESVPGDTSDTGVSSHSTLVTILQAPTVTISMLPETPVMEAGKAEFFHCPLVVTFNKNIILSRGMDQQSQILILFLIEATKDPVKGHDNN